MCGIAGIVDWSSAPVDVARACAMARAQAHRGPDGEGGVFLTDDGRAAWFDTLDAAAIAARVPQATTALVHRRLAIIDLSPAGAQPMGDPSGRFWLTFNGEIYNYVELLHELESRGHGFRSRSDTEVLLRAYLEWGPQCVERFNGMFAFAIWDAQRRTLFCARDHLGIKPLYYWYAGQRLLFASEPKAILAALGTTPRANMAAISDYLAFSYVLSEDTMFEGIHRLPAASRMLVDASGPRIETYWNPRFERDPRCGADEAVEELTALLRDAARLQTRSDVPVGVHLSGGVDSSAVCCLASAHLPNVHAFTARFTEGEEFDESRYARIVAEHVSADHHVVEPQRQDLRELLPRLIHHLDEPVEGPAVIGKYYVAEIVGRHLKVVLGGQGGDELFGGYDWYVKNLFTAATFGADAVLGDRATLPFLWESLRNESTGRLARSLWTNLGQRDVGQIFCRNWDRMGPDRMTRLLQPDRMNGHPLPEERFLEVFAHYREATAGDRMFKFDMRNYLGALLTSEDRLSMAFSVESRVPLLDYRIAELAGRLGFELKTRPGGAKALLRAAVRDVVPPAILARRDKKGFPTPIERWLTDPDLRLVDGMVLNDNEFARDHFDLGYVRRLSRSRMHVGSTWSEQMWRILCVSVWGRVFQVSR